ILDSDAWQSTPCGGLLTSCGHTCACVCANPPAGWRRPGVDARCDPPEPTDAYVAELDCSPPPLPAVDSVRCAGRITGAIEAPIVECTSTDLWSSRDEFVRFRLGVKTDGGAMVAALQLDFPKYEEIPN